VKKSYSFEFWSSLARIILRKRIGILVGIAVLTALSTTQWNKMRFSYTEANLLPDNHIVNTTYNDFLEEFGEEGNVVVVALKDSSLFNLPVFKDWVNLAEHFRENESVDLVISIDQLQRLTKLDDEAKFKSSALLEGEITPEKIAQLQSDLKDQLPVYEGLFYNSESGTVQTAIYLDKSVVNSAARKDFIVNDLIPTIQAFESKHNLDLRISGMPYIRTLNSQYIIDEIGGFIIAAILVTCFLFFAFFRSWRATFISLLVVVIGVMWTFGILGFLEYEITVLTALIPPVIIVIGIPNCIFLINKYQHEVNSHGNKAKSLQRVITKVGNATLMTNITTASGFATFTITQSRLLIEFGLVASLSILAIFLICLLIIPIIYSFLPMPKPRHLEHLNRKWTSFVIDWMTGIVREKRWVIYTVSTFAVILGAIGIYQMKISGSLLEDMPKNAKFYKDIRFFEDEFDGIMPIEIIVDTKQDNGVTKRSNIVKMAKLEDYLNEIPQLSRPVSIVSMVKYSKQAFYNGDPKYYDLPTAQESNFIMSYLKKGSNQVDLLKSFVTSDGRMARIKVFIKDDGIDQLEDIEVGIRTQMENIFPSDRYDVTITGKAYMFEKGTKYLVQNLLISLSLAIVLIALFIAYMFRSFRMILISLIPNIIPLIITAGVMGYLGVPIKPSTVLVFSIAFGISVDDTIHFLAKYRQELQSNRWRIKRSVFAALQETGISMLYTSVVLFFGFSVFLTSDFGGTVALGALISGTLLVAMLSNLLLLPSMLLTLEKLIANKTVLREPTIKIIPDEDDGADG